jgi:hypothetical protein
MSSPGRARGNDVAWFAADAKIAGDWARVGLGAPAQYHRQGELYYFRKVNGSCTFVAGGS